MSMYDKGYQFVIHINGQMLEEVVYASNVSLAKDLVKAKYGSAITYLNGTGRTFPSKAELEEKAKRQAREQETKLKFQQEKDMREQEKKIKELEIKTINIEYKQQAQNLQNEVKNIQLNLQEWEQSKLELEEDINSTVSKIKTRINEFSEYSQPLQEVIDKLNEKIKSHNSKSNIYKDNKVNLLNELNMKLNTEVDFGKKVDEDLGIGGWIFIILILALILYGVDWFFELNIYSSAYEFLKNLFGSKT